MVEFTNLPLKAIAISIGYSLPHFCEVFKETYDMTPGQIRKGGG
ncbi:AraC family transcriptional regulator [Sinomicrobium pectinilyticum]|uniref:AraC family transcriptional regulator n=1 Tax=Sinomicrobium pectinilyticum TaxID=1084421 RepID=A0A3N0ELZ2_SINP1|nr:AraC family transcriptional regulator [Sinomicrobium pectinilyticum]